MNRIDVSSLSAVPNFIGGWIMEPTDLCDDLVEFFDIHKEKQKKGAMLRGIDPNLKKTVDITIRPKDLELSGYEIFNSYIENLFLCYKDYIEQWPFLAEIASHVETGSFNLQRYQRGDHFQQNHTERASLASSHRLLAWMTYLNDVEDGGQTSFSHYGINVKPQKGKTLIWPAEWTHAHSGNVLNAGVKHIITGWMHFPEKLSID